MTDTAEHLTATDAEAKAAGTWWMQMLTVPGFNPSVLDAYIAGHRDGAATAPDSALVKLLVEADSLLSLTVYRGEDRHNARWLREAQDLIGRIRRITEHRGSK